MAAGRVLRYVPSEGLRALARGAVSLDIRHHLRPRPARVIWVRRESDPYQRAADTAVWNGHKNET